jgi:hypothetical protein
LQQRGNHGVSSPPKTLSSRSQTLSQLQPVEPPQATPIDREEAAGARGPRGGINDRFAPANYGGTRQSRIVLLAPLP